MLKAPLLLFRFPCAEESQNRPLLLVSAYTVAERHAYRAVVLPLLG